MENLTKAELQELMLANEAIGTRVAIIRELLVERDALFTQVDSRRTWIVQFDEMRYLWVGNMTREEAKLFRDETGRLPCHVFGLEDVPMFDAWVEHEVTHVCVVVGDDKVPLMEPNSLRRLLGEPSSEEM